MEEKTPIDSATRLEVIEELLRKIRTNYVFPTVAEKIEASIRQRMYGGEYDTITTAELLTQELTMHLQEVSKDKHLHLFYTSEEMLERNDHEEPAPKWWEESGPLLNFGFEKVERLPGNIGYLDFRAFYSAEVAGEVTISAMNFLAN